MEIVVTEKDVGVRLDKYLSDALEDVSRSFAAKLCEEGKVTLDAGNALDILIGINWLR